MAHLTLPKKCPKASNTVQSGKVKLFKSEYANTKKCVFMARLKDDKSVMFIILTGRAFHLRAQLNERIKIN